MVMKRTIVLTAKGKNEWKEAGRKGKISRVRISRRNNKDFGLHWIVTYNSPQIRRRKK